MTTLPSGLALLVVGSLFVGGPPQENVAPPADLVSAATAALEGLVDEGRIPAPEGLQVARFPADSLSGETPGNLGQTPELTLAVLSLVGGDASRDGWSLATCEELPEPAGAARCAFPDGPPVDIRSVSMESDQATFAVSIMVATDAPLQPLALYSYVVSVEKTRTGEWRFTSLDSEQPALVRWQYFASVRDT